MYSKQKQKLLLESLFRTTEPQITSPYLYLDISTWNDDTLKIKEIGKLYCLSLSNNSLYFSVLPKRTLSLNENKWVGVVFVV